MQTTLFVNEPNVMDRLKESIREFLDDREYRRLDHILELIERDRKIRNEFKRLRKEGYSKDEAIRYLSGQFFLSEDQIDYIVYPRNRQ